MDQNNTKWSISVSSSNLEKVTPTNRIGKYLGCLFKQPINPRINVLQLWEAEDYEGVYQEIIASKVDDSRKAELVKKPDDSEEQQIQLSPEDYAVIGDRTTENPVENPSEAKEISTHLGLSIRASQSKTGKRSI